MVMFEAQAGNGRVYIQCILATRYANLAWLQAVASLSLTTFLFCKVPCRLSSLKTLRWGRKQCQ